MKSLLSSLTAVLLLVNTFHLFGLEKSTESERLLRSNPEYLIGMVNNDDEDEDGDDWNDWNVDLDFVSMKSYYPSIDIQWGAASPSIYKDKFSSDFAGLSLGDIRLGFVKIKKGLFDTESLIKYGYSFLYVSNITNEFTSKSGIEANEIESDNWRFGLGSSAGYGYNLGKGTDLILYRSEAISWINLNFKTAGKTGISDKDNEHLSYLSDGIRFGQYWDAGIKLRFLNSFAITGAYERQIVYNRHIFWSWILSETVGGIGQGIVSYFVKQVMKSSPKIGPVVYFVLKNALSYGLYELRSKSMNWPIHSDAPLMFDSYKAGLSFIF